jgi:hypothetical protein
MIVKHGSDPIERPDKEDKEKDKLIRSLCNKVSIHCGKACEQRGKSPERGGGETDKIEFLKISKE